MSAVKFTPSESALRAQRSLARASGELSSVFERLSSGQRINRASDDAAGLAIADQLKTRRLLYDQSARNISDGVSLLTIADGALEQQGSILTRLAELAEQSANGPISSGQREALSKEYRELRREIWRITESSEFNGIRVLQQSLGVALQVGVDGGVGSRITSSAVNALSNRWVFNSSTPNGVDFDNDTLLPDDPALWANQSEAALSASFGGNLISVVVAGADGSQRRGLVGLYQIDSFDAQSYTLVSFVQNNDGTFSASDETFDLAFRVSGGQPLAGGLYEQRFGAGADGGVGAREFRIGFSSGGIGFSTTSLTIDLSGLRLISGATPTVPTDFTVSGIEDRSRARGALDAVQSEIATLAQTRSRVGADQSRLNFAALLAKSSSVVAAAAEGRIRDADIAAETARLTQVQILQQAAVSVLQRANLDPQLALNLLRN